MATCLSKTEEFEHFLHFFFADRYYYASTSTFIAKFKTNMKIKGQCASC